MTDNPRTRELLRHLATRPGHDEVKSDFRQLLVEEFGVELGALDFERRVPEVRGRLDALIGRTVFEAKRNLDQEWDDVVRRMPDYLADREREEGERFVGIASDGLKWVVFERDGDQLIKLKDTTLDPDKAEIFLAWLDGAVALKDELRPDPITIRLELGQESVAFRRANGGLRALCDKLKDDPAVALKRQLWAQLLTLVYGREVESDALFFQHTFLVIVAKAIALAVLGLRDDNPRRVLSGAAFEAAGIFGAAESDFFDWVVAEPDGEALVRRILAHVRRFRLDQVESDVLKILYESLIDRGRSVTAWASTTPRTGWRPRSCVTQSSVLSNRGFSIRHADRAPFCFTPSATSSKRPKSLAWKRSSVQRKRLTTLPEWTFIRSR